MRHSRPSFDTKKFTAPNETLKIALLIANWNISYNQQMADSARDTLIISGLKAENISEYYIPGAFEIPYFCQKLFEQKKELDAIICFGTVIRGETYHFEIVANESARGIMDVMLKSSKPIINGILTVNTEEQAEQRASSKKDNKGAEFALSCLQVLQAT